MRLIDADSIKWGSVEEEYGSRTPAVVACQSLIQNSPTIDPVRRGKWVRDEIDKWKCSVCGTGNNYAYEWSINGEKLQDEYCPKCGARMGGGGLKEKTSDGKLKTLPYVWPCSNHKT